MRRDWSSGESKIIENTFSTVQTVVICSITVAEKCQKLEWNWHFDVKGKGGSCHKGVDTRAHPTNHQGALWYKHKHT